MHVATNFVGVFIHVAWIMGRIGTLAMFLVAGIIKF